MLPGGLNYAWVRQTEEETYRFVQLALKAAQAKGLEFPLPASVEHRQYPIAHWEVVSQRLEDRQVVVLIDDSGDILNIEMRVTSGTRSPFWSRLFQKFRKS